MSNSTQLNSTQLNSTQLNSTQLNSNPPLVSICIPSYNHANFISETICSVILQDYPNIELLIVDDSSTDNSDEIINSFTEKCKTRFVRFAYHKNKKNKGLSRNLNHAIKWAKGKYFYAIASDDILMPNKTSLLVTNFENLDENYAAIFGDALFINENSENVYVAKNLQLVKVEDAKNITETLYKSNLELYANLHNKNYLAEDFCVKYTDFFYGNYLPAMSSLIKLDCMKKVGGYTDGNTLEDLEMWLKLTQKYAIKLLTTPVAYYRFHSRNTNRIMQKQLLLDELKLINSQKNFALTHNLSNEFFGKIAWLIREVYKVDPKIAKHYADLNGIKLVKN